MNYATHAENVTRRLVDMIQTGSHGQWAMPWHTHDLGDLLTAHNATTGNRYAGANVLTLAVDALERGYPMTFTTPPAADNDLGTNIATTGIITDVTSEFSDVFAATNAIDGNPATEWSTAGDGDNPSIEIDLGQPQSITAIVLGTRHMTDGTAITPDTFAITIGDKQYGPYLTGTEPAMFDEPVTGRTVRIDADQTTGGNTGATEIEIYTSG